MIGRSNAVSGGSELSPQKITNNTNIGMDVPSEALPGEFVDIKPFFPISENVDAEDITQSPEKYMGYVPKTGTLEEQLAEMRTQLEIINRFIAEGGTQ